MEEFKRDLFGIGLGTSEWKKRQGLVGLRLEWECIHENSIQCIDLPLR